MIRVLIVDDEVHSAEGVRCATDWESLGVDQVFTAYSMKQAIKVLEREEIEIVLTDVEMPKGSGLDLLAWIQEQGMKPVSILLTSYAEFEYAKQAIELGTMDYLLKPVEQSKLYAVFKKAVARVLEERKKSEINKLAEYWTASEKEHQSNFWRSVLEGRIAPDSEVIRREAEKAHLVYHENYKYLPILFRIYLPKSNGNWLTRTRELREEMEKIVFPSWRQVVPVYRDDRLFAITEEMENLKEHREILLKNCAAFIRSCQENLDIVFSCYVGEFCEPGELALQYEQLTVADGNNVAERSGVFDMTKTEKKLTYDRPDVESWIHMLARKEYEEAYREIERYLDLGAHERRLDRAVLDQLSHDFMQCFYSFLENKGLQAHLFMEDKESMELYQNRNLTVGNFKKWIHYVIEKSSDYLEREENSKNAVSQVKHYIKQHLGEELNRNQLAGIVFVSEDYLSRIFYQETGIKLSEYITQERLKKAAQLLAETDMTVGDIADEVGYGNVAYFTKVFREKNQITPAQYRARFRKK